jgi:DNA polymerase III alpha subunit
VSLLLVRQRPGTASGVIFMTLEDETGVANVVVWPKSFEQFRPQVLGARLTLVRGELQSELGSDPGRGPGDQGHHSPPPNVDQPGRQS